VFPGHAGCYHLLGFVLYILNRLEEAMIMLDFGRTVDPEYEPIDGMYLHSKIFTTTHRLMNYAILELEEEISKILNGYKGSEGMVCCARRLHIISTTQVLTLIDFRGGAIDQRSRVIAKAC
jgi:hypothetical protein